MKRFALLITSIFCIIFLSACFKCETCHRIKVTDDQQTGAHEITAVQEVCSRRGKRKLEKDVVESTGSKSFWVCDILDKDAK